MTYEPELLLPHLRPIWQATDHACGQRLVAMHQIPIRGSVWEEGKAGWLEVDTVALCGGASVGECVWMADRILVLNAGRFTAEFERGAASADLIHASASSSIRVDSTT